MEIPPFGPAGASDFASDVPRIVHRCGALLVARTLLLPYAVADRFTAFATAPVGRTLATPE